MTNSSAEDIESNKEKRQGKIIKMYKVVNGGTVESVNKVNKLKACTPWIFSVSYVFLNL